MAGTSLGRQGPSCFPAGAWGSPSPGHRSPSGNGWAQVGGPMAAASLGQRPMALGGWDGVLSRLLSLREARQGKSGPLVPSGTRHKLGDHQRHLPSTSFGFELECF